ncbi:MAG: hypothetical protein ACYCY6_02735 [Minisyncoccota bacterium]
MMQEIEEYLEEGIFHDKDKDPDSVEFMGYAEASTSFKRGNINPLLRCLDEDIQASENTIYRLENLTNSDEDEAELFVKENLNLDKLLRMRKSLLD